MTPIEEAYGAFDLCLPEIVERLAAQTVPAAKFLKRAVARFKQSQEILPPHNFL